MLLLNMTLLLLPLSLTSGSGKKGCLTFYLPVGLPLPPPLLLYTLQAAAAAAAVAAAVLILMPSCCEHAAVQHQELHIHYVIVLLVLTASPRGQGRRAS
jgi:hypothetical protein